MHRNISQRHVGKTTSVSFIDGGLGNFLELGTNAIDADVVVTSSLNSQDVG